MAFARMDPLLYPRDMLLRETPLHVPLLPPLVAILQATTSLQLGFWLITIVLSLLTVLAMYRWMRALGVPGSLLPVAAIVACAGWVQGLGRGEYHGVFGDSFHFEWAALCALLWAYDGVLRARWVPVAALLVLSLLLHPVVGAQGSWRSHADWPSHVAVPRARALGYFLWPWRHARWSACSSLPRRGAQTRNPSRICPTLCRAFCSDCRRSLRSISLKWPSSWSWPPQVSLALPGSPGKR